MILLLEASVESTPYAFSLTTVGIVGFLAAIVIGSIAWYNSKRPVGWEGKNRPEIVPDIDK
ncbi:MAG: hypothetical protein AAFR58_13220 [Cyanobacteria bacterium J06627_28]